ncbi:hypothetical protein C8R43DRAFT_964317 [Mycena crocata]|nr:hypothetical protein C8R43DRAFT_964317 [Mycena crocata]
MAVKNMAGKVAAMADYAQIGHLRQYRLKRSATSYAKHEDATKIQRINFPSNRLEAITPGVLLAVGALLLLPASPRLLVLKGQYDEAETSLVKLRRRDDALTKFEMLKMRVEATLTKKYRARKWSGINALLYYGPTLVRSIGLQSDTVGLIVSGGIGIVKFLAVGPAVVWIDRLDGSAVMAAPHLLIALLVQQLQTDWPSHKIAAWTAVAGIYTFTLAYGVSFGPIGWVLPSEVFPLSVSGRGVALATATNWANNFLMGAGYDGGVAYVRFLFPPFATACFLAYLWTTYSVPETAGVALEHMDRVFGTEVGREDAVRRREVEEKLGLREAIAGLTNRHGDDDE